MMNSAIYTGWVRHHRFLPHEHRFQYQVSMMLLDLDEMQQFFGTSWFWSEGRHNLVSFWRNDHHGESEDSLAESIRNLVEDRLGFRPSGSIRLLTNPRYFGFAMNPVSFYYCYDASNQLQAIVSEVNNTPWGEQHCYAFAVENRNLFVHRFEFHKDFHVSPFMSMDQEYDWRIGEPRSKLVVHMKNIEKKATMLDATLALERTPISGYTLTKNLLRYPFVTGKVFAGIYWNALRLYWKKTPFFPHPKKKPGDRKAELVEVPESNQPTHSPTIPAARATSTH